MARPNSALRGNKANADGILPHSGARSLGPVGGATDSATADEHESLNVFERAWLYLTDSDYYHKHRGPTRIDKVRAEVAANVIEHGTFYGFTDQQREEIGKGVYESTKGAIPLAETVATIATLPFGGGTSVGTRLVARLGIAGAKKAIMAHFIDSLGKEMVAVSVEMLAGKEIDYSKRAREIAIAVAVGSAGAGLKHKLAPVLERKFVALAKQLSKYRVAGLDLGKEITAEQAVDAKIVEEAVSAMVDSTASVVMEIIK